MQHVSALAARAALLLRHALPGCALLVLLLLLPGAARAQAPVVTVTPAGPLTLCPGSTQTLTAMATGAPGFNVAGSGFNGFVSALAVQADGKVLVGGNFSTYNGTAAAPDNVLRLNADGSLDNTFNPGGGGANGPVSALAVQADGKVLVGGNFSTYNGTAAPGQVLRLNADGSLDNTFNPGGGGANGPVSAVAVQADGKVLVGGNFSSYNGSFAALDGVLRLNANGSLDATFNNGGTGTNNTVLTLAVQADGKVLVGGLFTTYNNAAAAPDGIMRLNADGSLDATFNPGGAGANTGVRAVAVQADGKVLIGGDFSTYNGTAAAPDQVLRLNANGSLDNTFNSGGAGANGPVSALAVQADGKVLVGGDFSTYNGTVATPDNVLRLNADGSLDNTFNNGGAGANAGVRALAVQADGKVLVGGDFTVYNGTAAAPDFVLRLNADGSLNNTATVPTYTWSNGATGPSITVSQPGDYQATATTTNGTGFSNVVRVTAPPAVTVTVTPAGPLALPAGGSATLTATATLAAFNAAGSGFNGVVRAVAVQADGKVLAGGSFTNYNSSAAPSFVLRLNADGSLDTTFNSGGTGANGEVYALAVQADGKVLIGGQFTDYNGNAAPDNVLRLNADGSLDATFNNGGAGASNTVNTLAVQADGKVLVGGTFTAYNGNAAAPDDVLRLNADGSLDNTFNGGGAGANGGVYALAVQADGKVLIGGAYRTYNGNAAIPSFVLRLNADGSLDTTFNSGGAGANNTVNTLAVQADGKVLIGGFFTDYNNSAAPDRVLRLNADGSLDAAFNPGGAGASNTVNTLAVQADGKVLVGGTFTAYNGNAAAPDNLLRLNVDGSLDATFNSGGTGIVSSYVQALAVQPDGQVLVGGLFTAYNGNAAPDNLLRLNADGSLNNAATPLPGYTFVFTPGNTPGPTRTVSTAGTYAATATDPATGCTYTSNAVVVTMGGPADLTISSPQTVPAGTYRNITVTGPTTGGAGTATLGGAVSVTGTVTVQAGGTLLTDCQPLTGGPGTSFVLAAGATLAICDPAGIAASGPAGAVQTAARSFSPEASYVYTGTAAQVTGTGLPATVRALTSTNASPVTLTAPVAVAQTLTIGAAGNLLLSGQALTLRSSASGTALVVNSGTGVVSGGTAAVQRYIDPSLNPGLGYRHYSSPVSGNTLSDLATAGFTPVFNPAYNTAATPATVTPFPTVFGYDQARLATAVSNYAPFDKGWYSPLATDAMPAGQGFTVNLAAAETVDFTGTLRTGDYARTLARNAGPTAADAGWQLVGNPYPAPLDWSRVNPADRPGLDASMYVFESTSQYGGQYRSYVNGIGSASPLVATAQGFFVRVSQGQTSGTLTFRNAQRVTDYAQQVPLRRGGADARPQLTLTLSGAGLTDAFYLYAEAGATPSADAAYDAAKLPNPTGLNLASLTAGGAQLAIDGRADFATATRIPLFVGVPAAGTYTLTAAALANLAGTQAELVDSQTGTRTPLTTGASYAFTLSGTTAPGRFWLNLTPAASPLAASAAGTKASFSLYPNPARAAVTVLGLPAGASVTVFDALGRQVLTRVADATGTAQLALPAGLAAGVYVVRSGAQAQRLTVE